MKKNLLLFIGNVLILFIVLLLLNGAYEVKRLLEAVCRAELTLLILIVIVALIMYLMKRSLNISNKKYFKKLFRAQLIIYTLFFGLAIWARLRSTDDHIGEEYTTYYTDSIDIDMNNLRDKEKLDKEIAVLGQVPDMDTAKYRRSNVRAALAYEYLIDTFTTRTGYKYVDTMLKVKQISVMPVNKKVDGVRYQDRVVFTFQILEDTNIFYARYLCNDNSCILLNFSKEVNINNAK